ncbi:CcdB family protein [Rhizobium sp. L1K21]|uniref:CcdB family protein n=1 Tax=Rhizobium sp. L1K21 TaxID=2954933 RepID=UPI002092E538|nr:CcdB family protein [Rhizobium sp. L1K21]MCO6187407.1 CcdB family protein [Rhizobium sp. L1K21]
MARFRVYRLKTTGIAVLDLQSGLVDGLSTRVVAPLLPERELPVQMVRLNPKFEIDGETLVMATHLMSAVATSLIGEELANLADKQDKIVSAVDFLFQGF